MCADKVPIDSGTDDHEEVWKSLFAQRVPIIRGEFADDYEEIWKSLCDLYEDNQFLLAMAWMDRITSIRSIKDTREELQRFADEITIVLWGLKHMNLGEELKENALMLHTILKKLPATVKTAFYQTLKHRKIPSLCNELLPYLQRRARNLWISEIGRPKCPGSCGHRNLFKCKSFKQMSVADRQTFVRSNDHCSRCLSVHRGAPCNSNRRCYHCSELHHSWVCDMPRQKFRNSQ